MSYIRSRCSLTPEVVLVLGSGLGPIADEVQDATIIPYAEVPHFHAPAVQGHPGRLVIGTFAGVPALVLQVCASKMRACAWRGGQAATSSHPRTDSCKDACIPKTVPLWTIDSALHAVSARQAPQ